MRLLFGTVFALAIAAAIGLGATWIALTRGTAYGGVTIGAWTAWPKNGTAGIDPYARAMVARTGELPVGSGDGVAFYARTDDAGQPLDGRCDVLLSGITPQARFWTVTLYDPEGRLVANSVQRQGFTSQEIIRKADGSFDITSGRARGRATGSRPGGVEKYLLVLRLYDTPIGMATRTGRDAPMPTIVKEGMPVIRLALWFLGALLLGGIVHLATVLLLPRMATQDAYARVSAIAPVNSVIPVPSPTPEKAVMPFMDPAFAVSVCRYDLSRAPLKFSVPISQAYTSVSFYTRSDVAYYAINDRAAGRRVIELDLMTAAQRAELPEDQEITAADRLIVTSPTTTGLIMIRALVPESGWSPAARNALAAAQCRPQ